MSNVGIAPKGKVWKTNSEGQYILIDDPNIIIEDGKRIKNRVITNIVTKKKRRKKLKTHRGKNGRRKK